MHKALGAMEYFVSFSVLEGSSCLNVSSKLYKMLVLSLAVNPEVFIFYKATFFQLISLLLT